MAAKQRHRTRKITPPGGRRNNHRLRLDLKLTAAEIRELRAAADREVRSIGNYVGWIVVRGQATHPAVVRSGGIGGAI